MSAPEPKRERVVLSQRRGARPIRTRAEVAAQTGVGEHLVRGLVRAQLGLALRIGGAVALLCLAVPLLGSSVEALHTATVFGLPLNWLILGLGMYPVLYVAGRIYIRLAEAAERDFVALVDAEEHPPGNDAGPPR
ncbi:MAG: hypothetical protein QM658_08585 [Gordonia sp. (in: high G+C Gram-positive bacteria)]